MTIQLRSGSATDRGKVRPTNQDCVLVDEGVYAVADGMGGHAGGEVAARTAVDTIRAEFSRAAGHPAAALLARSVQAANRAVWNRAGSERSLRGMGTTLVGLAPIEGPDGDRIVVANVGDSRAYVLKNRNLVQITTDHTVVEQKLAAQELTAEEAANHPHRHILTRALGTEPNVEVDAWQLQPSAGDRYLLCSDGLFNEVNNEEIAALLQRSPDPGQAATQLVELARAHGGSDNVSVVVVDVVGTGGTSVPPSPAAAVDRTDELASRAGAGGEKSAAAEAPRAPAGGGAAAGLAGGLAGGAAGGLAGGAFGAAMMGIRTGSAAVPGPPSADFPRAGEDTSYSNQSGEKAPPSAAPQPQAGAQDPAHTPPAGESGGSSDPSPQRDAGAAKAGDFSTPDSGTEPNVPKIDQRAAKEAGQAGGVLSLPSLNPENSMSSVMAGVLRAADSPDWQDLTISTPRTPGEEKIDPIRLDQLFAASERAYALRDAEDRETLRDTIRHNEAGEAPRPHKFPHFVSQLRSGAGSEDGSPHLVDLGGRAKPLITWRVIGFLLLLAIVIGGSFGSVAWFARNSYFVGIDHGALAIYQGRPGGLAWFQPRLIDKTSVPTSQVLPSRLSDIRAGVLESSENNARLYVRNLVAEARSAAGTH